MALTPADIRKADFRRRMGGYVVEEVRSFLETVAREVDALHVEHAAQQERIRQLEEKVAEFRHTEKLIQDTLTTTQQAVGDLKENARRDAERQLEQARAECRDLLARARAEEAELRHPLATLQGQKQGFVAEFRGLLESYLKVMERFETGIERKD